MNAQHNRFGFVDNALARLGGAFRAGRGGARAKGAAAQTAAIFEPLEHRQMMSVTTPGAPAPGGYTTVQGHTIYAPPSPVAYDGPTEGLMWLEF